MQRGRPTEQGDAPTKRQLEILAIVAAGTISYREIGRKTGIRSTNGVSDHIKALAKKGLLVMGTPNRLVVHTLTEAGGVALGPCEHTSQPPIAYTLQLLRTAGTSPMPPVRFCPFCGRRIPPP